MKTGGVLGTGHDMRGSPASQRTGGHLRSGGRTSERAGTPPVPCGPPPRELQIVLDSQAGLDSRAGLGLGLELDSQQTEFCQELPRQTLEMRREAEVVWCE